MYPARSALYCAPIRAVWAIAMTADELDVVAVGNAIVDVLSHADDGFLRHHGLSKGAMTLLDAPAAEALYARMGPGLEMSGCSAANTMAGLASCGGTGAFIGRVADDQLGQVFRHDIRAAGVAFDTPSASDGRATARCLILVTPDAQRTMATFLGASAELTPADIDPELIGRARFTYLEGYLWDPPGAREALRKAMRLSREKGRKVAFTLSDPFCVERHRREFLELLSGQVQVLFANEAEIRSLHGVDSFESALERTRGRCEIAVLTRSGLGSVIVTDKIIHVVPAAHVDRVVDTTGAGDLFAAGFLYGLARGHGPAEAGRMGAIAAAEVISHMGARPQMALGPLVRAALA